MQIITNNQVRDLLTYSDLPVYLQSEFDYIEPDSHYDARLFKYKGAWYDAADMMPACDIPELADWHGYESETYFSGIVVRLNPCEDGVIVGRYFS